MKAPRDWATTAPLPADPTCCRWCHGRKREIAPAERCILHLAHKGPHLFAHTTVTPLPHECQATKPALVLCGGGCASNDAAPYLGHCSECGRSFQTGKTLATLCYSCEQTETAAMQETPFEGESYNYQRTRRGGYR